mgnify:CR=1 FL=1
MKETSLHKKQKSKNLAVLAVLVFLILTFFIASLVKISAVQG